jgi:hypothetical protein
MWPMLRAPKMVEACRPTPKPFQQRPNSKRNKRAVASKSFAGVGIGTSMSSSGQNTQMIPLAKHNVRLRAWQTHGCRPVLFPGGHR